MSCQYKAEQNKLICSTKDCQYSIRAGCQWLRRKNALLLYVAFVYELHTTKPWLEFSWDYKWKEYFLMLNPFVLLPQWSFLYKSLELKLNVGIYLFTFSYSRQRYLFLKMGKEVLDLDAVFCI